MLNPSVFVQTLTSFGSIRDRLEISLCQKILSAHITDALVDYAAKHRTREVSLHLALPRQCADVTDESIMNFLTAPASGQQIRKLEVTKPRVSPQFFEKLAEVRIFEGFRFLVDARNLHFSSIN